MSDPTRPYGAGYANGVTITLRMTAEQAKAVDAAAQRAGMTRSAWVRATLLAAASEHGNEDAGDE